MRNATLGEDYTGWVDTRYRWPEGVLYYHLANKFTTSERQQIEHTLRSTLLSPGQQIHNFRKTTD